MCTGILEPTIRIGAPGIVETEKLTPLWGSGPVENDSFAATNAERRVWASAPAESGNAIPNWMALANFSAPGATCHFAFSKICEIWIAKNRASGSPSVYRRLTLPGLRDRTFSSSAMASGGMTRHATTCLSFSVSNLAAAASCANLAVFSFALTISSRNPSALASASAARALVAPSSLFKYVSLTFPIQTNSTVEMTPAIRLAISPIFAQSDSFEAHSSDGHIEMPPWLPLSAIGIVLLSGIFGLVMVISCMLNRKKYCNTKIPLDKP